MFAIENSEFCPPLLNAENKQNVNIHYTIIDWLNIYISVYKLFYDPVALTFFIIFSLYFMLQGNSRKGFSAADCYTIYTIYLSLCTLTEIWNELFLYECLADYLTHILTWLIYLISTRLLSCAWPAFSTQPSSTLETQSTA